MENYSPELQTFLNLLEKKTEMTAMLAPSFPIVFSYPEIIGKLKKLGFAQTAEVARGAVETNNQLLKLIKNNPNKRYITSPCPSIVRLIRHKYPSLKQFLAENYSPMVNTAKIVKQKYPNSKPVFIGPCPIKKLEAKQDFPQLGIIVLTYKELSKVFALKNIQKDSSDSTASFDIIGPPARLYPVSGGLAQSSNLNNLLTDEEFDVISGFKLAEQSLKEFPNNRLKVLDILYCDGGCIAGLGIDSQLTNIQRREKIISFWD